MFDEPDQSSRSFIRLAVFCATGLVLIPLLVAGLKQSKERSLSPPPLPNHNSFAAAKPSAADLSGIWLPDEKTFQMLKDRGPTTQSGRFKPYMLIKNDRFKADDLRYLDNSEGPQVKLFTGRGTWSIYHERMYWLLNFSGENVGMRGILYKEGEQFWMSVTIGEEHLNAPMWFYKTRGN